jgi:hypothetical protein
MDSCLTQDIPVSTPVWRKYSVAPVISGYSNVTTITPIVEDFLGKVNSEGQLNSDHLFFRLKAFQGSGECLLETVSKKTCKAFCKVTHLIDPIRSIQNYYKHPEKGERRLTEKLTNPMNQAYIDCFANYLLGQLRERGISPHFCLFYGGFKGVADTYRYNITEEFSSYRRYKDFWNRKRAGDFDLYISREDGSVDSSLFGTPSTSSLRSTAFSYSTGRSSDSEGTHESLASLSDESNEVELESIHSFKTGPSRVSRASRGSRGSGTSGSYDSGSSDSDDNSYSVFSEYKNFPVMLIFQERMDGVIDDMLEDDTMVGADHGSPEWEKRWIAWTFQIIAALCTAQGLFGFTHNDLHTNNIVWTKTEETWIFYKSRDGTVWRIPTYGKILRLIDFGRSIYRVGSKWYTSDDYNAGGDADGQHNFASIKNDRSRTIYPNPSFDLCRYSVSVMDALFPEMPIENLEGQVLSQEGSWTVRETESPLWNLLWSWLIDEDGKNVLKDQDGTERFPDFDLYQHITEKVKSAKPQEQIHKEVFHEFKCSSVGDWETVYPLFC